MAAAAAAIDRMSSPSRGHFELRRETSEANEILQGVEDGEKMQLQRTSKNQVPGTSRALPLSPPPPGLPSIPSLTQRSPSGAGTVVGWGAVEKYGDSAASRGFLRELNKKRLAAFSNPSQYQKNGSSASFDGNGTVESNNNGGHHLTTAIKSADMEDVLRLRKVELPFIDRLTCERWYGSRGRPIRLIDAQFCAGLYEGGKDACRVSLENLEKLLFYVVFNFFP